jgi:DNA-binding CsgD family transcriptional regulator
VRRGGGHNQVVELLERDDLLSSLAEYADSARLGEGRLVLIAGESGVGKTSLLETLQERLQDDRWLFGACDGSFTPRPLGPLYDVAGDLGGPLDVACRTDTPREQIFRLLLDELGASTRLIVLVVEDVHWADEATLDLLRFLGRRIRGSKVLLLVTYRDDGLASDHPLRAVLGELVTQRSTRRIGVPPLTREAVAHLVDGTDVDAAELHRLTGGNPFYLTEILGAGGADLPQSANDAVLARISRLPAHARQTLDAVAVSGTRVDVQLLAAVVEADPAAVETSLEASLAVGVLVSDPEGVRFRHEIARLAVEAAVPPHRRAELHRRVLAALQSARCVDDARLAHHAEGASDGEAVLLFAPRAARRAAELAAHRESAAQYERALRFAEGLDPAALASLYDGLAIEDALIDRWEGVAEAHQHALALWREAGDQVRVGDTLRMLSRAMWRLCRGQEAEAASVAALEILEPLPISRELGWAYVNLAGQRMAEDSHAAIELAKTAQALAIELGDDALLSNALNTEGCALANLGLDGVEQLQQSLAVALDKGLEDQVGRGYANLLSVFDEHHRFAESESLYSQGIAYCEEHDITTFLTCLRGGRSIAATKLGRWSEAAGLARSILDRRELSPVNRLNPLLALGRIRLRQGDPEAALLIAEATALAEASEDAPYVGLTALLRLERAWLMGDPIGAGRELQLALANIPAGDDWSRGEVVMLARLCGLEVIDVRRLPEPYAATFDGDWRTSARLWGELGCPFEQALALLESHDASAMAESLHILDALGAHAAVAVVQREMRRLGHRVIPRGRRTATRDDEFGLTSRERQVLSLICEGRTNVEIARELFISEKTVEHHVSAVLTKLGVSSRRAAAQLAAMSGPAEAVAN